MTPNERLNELREWHVAREVGYDEGFLIWVIDQQAEACKAASDTLAQLSNIYACDAGARTLDQAGYGETMKALEKAIEMTERC